MKYDHWSEQAACRDHPLLEPDAWFELRAGVPRGDGLKAMIVCRFACPVKAECGTLVHDRNTIAAGGWTNNRGVFSNPGNGEYMDLELAATYLGTTVERLHRQFQRLGITPVGMVSGRNLYTMDNVLEVAEHVRKTPHGTLNAHELHVLRGEQPCTACREVVSALQLPLGA